MGKGSQKAREKETRSEVKRRGRSRVLDQEPGTGMASCGRPGGGLRPPFPGQKGGAAHAPNLSRSESEANRCFLHRCLPPGTAFPSRPNGRSSPGDRPSSGACGRSVSAFGPAPPGPRPPWREPLPDEVPIPLRVRAGSQASGRHRHRHLGGYRRLDSPPSHGRGSLRGHFLHRRRFLLPRLSGGAQNAGADRGLSARVSRCPLSRPEPGGRLGPAFCPGPFAAAWGYPSPPRPCRRAAVRRGHVPCPLEPGTALPPSSGPASCARPLSPSSRSPGDPRFCVPRAVPRPFAVASSGPGGPSLLQARVESQGTWSLFVS